MGAIDLTTPRPATATSDHGTSPETALVRRAQRGDHGAFASLLDGRLVATLRTVTAILGNESDAHDATQAIFLSAWRNLPSLRDPELFTAWFGRIVVNTCRSSMRGRRRRTIREIPVSMLPDHGESLASASVGQEGTTESADRLERALDRITPSDRTILWLHHYEELPLADIGIRLGVPAKTVKSRLFTARRALERALEAEDR